MQAEVRESQINVDLCLSSVAGHQIAAWTLFSYAASAADHSLPQCKTSCLPFIIASLNALLQQDRFPMSEAKYANHGACNDFHWATTISQGLDLLPAEGIMQVSAGQGISVLDESEHTSDTTTRPWSWSWAWTPPSIPGTPEGLRSADAARLSTKFRSSSQAIAGVMALVCCSDPASEKQHHSLTI